MAKISHDSVHIDASHLLSLCRSVLLAQGVPEADAAYVAWHLVETSLRGTDSHGIARLTHYVLRLKNGTILPTPTMTFTRKAPSLGLLDGGHGLGHVVTVKATDHAIALAEETGAGWVAVQNSSHCGALAPFGLRLAERGMIGLVFTHVDPMVLPHGAREPFCGTNPICLAAPGSNGRTLCLDMATSIVPWNLVANAAREGIPIPAGWGVDKNGQGTTAPQEVSGLYPFGSYKGSGLGIMIDVFCAMLTSTPYGPDIPKMYKDLTLHRRLGGLVGAISIRHFIDVNFFKERVFEMVSRLGALKPAEGFDRPRFPGEVELETRREREKNGVPIGVQTLAELNRLAVENGLPELKEKAAALS